ncbi:MAG: hypothetical protein IJF84_13475 [Thermoguttaceae bacterium]|nr:hypothetical protein [Thermoguttaceae bacterium]
MNDNKDLFSNGADWETDEQMCRVRCGSGIIADVHATIEDKDYGEAMNANMRLIKEAPVMFEMLRDIDIFSTLYGDENLVKYIRKTLRPLIWQLRLRAKVEPGMKRLAEKKEKRDKEKTEQEKRESAE